MTTAPRSVLWRRIVENRALYVMMLPGLLFLLVVKYVPMYGLQVAFKDFDPWVGIWKSEYVGFTYFIQAFKSDIFWRAFNNTLIISLYKWVFGMPMPIILAILLNELRVRFLKRIVQSVSYFPHLISWVVIGGLAYSFLGSYGFINQLLQMLGFGQVIFYQNPDVWRSILVLTEIWKSVGWGSILYLAALTAVNTDLYEAIEVDGGGRFAKIWHVDLPTLLPVFAIILILNSSSLIMGNFDQVFALIGNSIVSPGSLLASKTEILEVYTYRVGLLEGSFSFASAIGFFQNVLAFIFILGTNFAAGRIYEDKRYTLF